MGLRQALNRSPESPPESRAASERSSDAPDFFIVGHPKCGTTALYEMLRSHPQIFMPELKETRYFARELHPSDPSTARSSQALEPEAPTTAAGRAVAEPAVLPDSPQAYAALFCPARAGQRTGEASPSYLRSRLAAGRIAQARPDARIIAIFREPADFLRSLHLELVKDHVETEPDLRTALALEPRRRQPEERERHPGLVYGDYVCYVEQLRRYEQCFSPSQIMVLIYDDFRADNAATVRSVLRFLDVDDRAPLELVQANRSARVRSPRLDRAARSLYLGHGGMARALKRVVQALTPATARRRALAAFQRRVILAPPVPADEQLTLELRRRFKDEVVALSEHLERDLVGLWGYDRID